MKREIFSKIIEYPSNTIGTLPISIEEYLYLLYPGRLIGNKYVYDKNKHSRLLEKLSCFYNAKSANLIHKIGMAYSLQIASQKDLFTDPRKHIDAIEYSYNSICSLPVEILDKVLGFGYNGMVFEYDEEKVIKIAINNFPNTELAFFQYQKIHNRAIFPKIFSISDNYVIMERLLTSSAKLNRFNDYIKEYIKLNFLEEISYRTLNTNIEQLPQEFRSFVEELQISLQEIFNFPSIGDIKIENIGERESTGKVVIFDPVGGYIKNYHRITSPSL